MESQVGVGNKLAGKFYEFLEQRGDVSMLRKFCLSLVMMLAAGVANGALLVKYDFNPANGSPASAYNPASVDSLVTASAFNPNSGGSVASGVYTAGGTLNTNANNNKGDFTLQANDVQSQVLIDRIVFRFAPSVNQNANRNIVVGLVLPDGSEITAVNAVGTTANTYTVQDSTDLALLLQSFNEVGTLNFNFNAKLNGTQTSPQVLLRLDDIEIYGSVVPEPTSIAIFSSLGLVAVARRFRKKNA